MRLIYLLFLFPFCLLAQPRQVQTYTVAEGLAQSQVYAVLADRRGYVWAGTQGGGLSRFDGERFRTFSDGDGLPGNYVQALWEDAPGNLWIGTDQGVARYDGQTFETFLSGTNILAIDGRNKPEEIWVLTETQLYRRQGTNWDTLALPMPYLRPYCLVVEAHRLLLGTDRGAWQWDGQSWRTMPAEFAASHQVWALFRYQRGQTWALAPGNQLFAVGPDSLRARRVPAQTPTVFYVSPQGDSWLGTQDQGLFLLPKGGQAWVAIGKQQGLLSNHIRALTSDRWGNLWVGTSGGGLSCLRRAPFQAFDEDRGLVGKEVYALTYSDSLGLLFAVGEAGVFRQTIAGPTVFAQDSALVGQKIKALHYDAAGRLWMGTPGAGIKVKSANRWYDVGLCGQFVLDMVLATANSWWVATAYEGLSLLTVREDSTGLSFTCRSFGREHGLPLGRIESLAQDQLGRLLIAYRDRGLACWSPDTLYWQVTTADGLPAPTVRAVRQDTAGYYWLATTRGLVRLGWTSQKMHLRVFTNRDGLQSNNLYCLTIDQQGQLWVGSERGVDQVELDAARNLKQVTFYGQEAGFTGIETCTNAALTDSLGNVWLGTMNGLMLHENQSLRPTLAPPPELAFADIRILYRSVRDTIGQPVLNGWGQPNTKLLTLTNTQNHLSFDLQALDLAQPGDLQYQWQLAGWDEQWSPPATQQTITYANLPPGRYTFRARAVGKGERVSQMLVLPIEIVPAFWQTSWFRFCLVLAAILWLATLIWRWSRRWQSRQRQVEEKLRLDNRLLELENKALQLQMNPHFLANVLQGIQHDLNQGEYQRADQYLTKFGALMRATLYHSRSNRIKLSDELDNLRHYLDLESFRAGQRFTYHFHQDKELEADLIEIPPMLLQPFLENAIHHGLHGKATGGRIDITLLEEGISTLVVTIRDNGRGLAASAATRNKGHRSTALNVIRERLELLGYATEESPYHLAEVVEDGVVKGVEVVVRIPIIA
ncbi:MAG: hypothetical protein DA408_00710 [Bacteroidetes bacterium]|nr:MAG: hypothetical protein DA408_00710 [Bacteroidota bacterium]